MANEVKIILSADGSGLKVVTDGASDQFVKLGKNAVEAGDKAADSFVKLGKNAVEAGDKATTSFSSTRRGLISISEQLATTQDTVVGVGKAFAAAFVGGQALAMVKEMAMLNARFQELGAVMPVVGRNAGYTATEMNAAADSMQRAGISMLESRNTTIQLAQAQIDLGDASKLARIAQDAAVVGNINSSEALNHMIYGIKSGQIEVLRTIGINVNFEQSYKAMAAQLHVSTEALTEHQKMQARENAVLEEGTKLTGAYEAAMGTAGKQMRSMARYAEDLKVMRGEVFNEALTIGVMAFVDQLKDANAETKKLAENESLVQFGNDVTDVMAFTADAVMKVYATFKSVGDAIGWAAAQLVLMRMPTNTKQELDAYLAARDAINEESKLRQASYDKLDTMFQTSVEKRRAAHTADAAAKIELEKDYAQRSLVVMQAYANASADIQQKAQLDLAKSMYASEFLDKPKDKPVTSTHGTDDRAQKLAAALLVEKTAQDREKEIYDEREKMLTAYHAKLGLSDANFYAGQKTARDAYLDSVTSSYEAQYILVEKSIAKTPAELAAKKTHLLALTEAYEKTYSGITKLVTEGAVNELAIAQKLSDDTIKAVMGASHAEVDGLQKAIDAQSLHNAEIGKTKEQVELVKAAQEDAKIAALQGAADQLAAQLSLNEALIQAGDLDGILTDEQKAMSAIVLSGLNEQISRRKTLKGLMTDGAASEAAAQAAKDSADAWKHGWEETDKLARSVFTDWGMQGTNMAKQIGDTLKKALLSAIYEATLKPIAFQLYTSIVGGYPGTAGGGGSGLSALANGASAANTLTGGSLFPTLTLGGSSISAIGGSVATGIQAGFAGTDLAGAISAYSASGATGVATGLSAGSGIGAALAAIPGWGWAALGTAAVLAATSGYDIAAKGNYLVSTVGASGTNAVSTRADFEQTGHHLFGNVTTQNSEWGMADKAVTDYISKTVVAITAANKAYATSLGLTTDSIDTFTKAIDINVTGLDAAGQKAAIDAELVKFSADQASSAYATAVSAFAKEGETTSVTVARLATDLTSVNGVFEALGYKLMDVSVAGGAAAASLVEAMGGLNAFAQKTADYYKNYYTPEAQRANTVKQINAATAGTGLDAATASRDDFRALVEKYQNLHSFGSDKLYVALMNVQGAFASITPTAADAARALDDAAAKVSASVVENAAKVAAAEKDARNAAMSALTNAVDAEKSRITLVRDLAQESVASIQSVFDLLKTNVDSLYGSVASTAAMKAAQGNTFIDNALSTAKTTGYLPDQTQLADAISGARGGVEATIYASQKDADFTKLVLAGKLAELQDISGDQLTTADRSLKVANAQLDDLNLMLESYKLQVDAMNGVNTSVLSVVDAVTALQYLMFPDTAKNADGTLVNVKPGTSGGGGGPSSIYQQTSPAAGPISGYFSQKMYEGYSGTIVDQWITDPTQVAKLKGVNDIVQSIGVATPEDVQALAQAAIAAGATIQDVANATGYLAKDWQNVFSMAGVPAFAGGGYHPGGLALVGEKGPELVNFSQPAQIYTADQSRSMLGGNTERLEALVQSLTAEVQSLRAEVQAGNSHAERTANATNGRPDRPMLVETV